GRALGKQSLFEAALAKLPLTRSVIKNVLESDVDFAVRRVHAAAARLRQVGLPFPRWKLVKAAGLHYRLERNPKVKAAIDYEMRPFVPVRFIRNGEATPRGLARRVGPKLSRLRPMAILGACL